MHGHHRGGTIVITPAESNEWRESVDLRFAFNVASGGALPALLTALEAVKAADDAQLVDAHIARFQKMLRNVGKLTAFDGAVVLRDDLTVLGFGAKLNCPPEDFTVSRLNAVTREKLRERPIYELGGTRHQSAARFVNRYRDCRVAVSSQDGRLTLVAWAQESGAVVAISGFEHFVWGESR
jgi:hypothetical protein